MTEARDQRIMRNAVSMLVREAEWMAEDRGFSEVWLAGYVTALEHLSDFLPQEGE